MSDVVLPTTTLLTVTPAPLTVTVVAPHPRHDHFLNDPTHVRAVTPAGLEMFSQAKNREWIAKGLANTPLGQYLGVDFVIESVTMSPDEPWRGRLRKGEISQADLTQAMRLHNNVIVETSVVLKAIKPASAEAKPRLRAGRPAAP